MPRFKKLVIPAVVAASLLVAACGSSSTTTTNAAGSAGGGSSTTTSASNPSGGGGLTISTAKGSAGTYLTGASGRALYMWVADAKGKSNCSGGCASSWPPLTASSMPKTSGGADASQLTLISRSGGTKQVAYKGHPLYYFAGDGAAGMTNGQGSDGFGAKWWLVAPTGNPITTTSGTASTSSSSGGY